MRNLPGTVSGTWPVEEELLSGLVCKAFSVVSPFRVCRDKSGNQLALDAGEERWQIGRVHSPESGKQALLEIMRCDRLAELFTQVPQKIIRARGKSGRFKGFLQRLLRGFKIALAKQKQAGDILQPGMVQLPGKGLPGIRLTVVEIRGVCLQEQSRKGGEPARSMPLKKTIDLDPRPACCREDCEAAEKQEGGGDGKGFRDQQQALVKRLDRRTINRTCGYCRGLVEFSRRRIGV